MPPSVELTGHCHQRHPETGANVLEVMQGIRQTVDELNKGPLKREGLYLRQVMTKRTT